MTNAIVRTPSLKDAEVCAWSTPEAFTPDGESFSDRARCVILGRGRILRARSRRRGGMGRLVAEWIVDGRPGLDAWEMDSRRFGRHYTSRDYTLAAPARSTRPTTTSNIRSRAQRRTAASPLAHLRALERARRGIRRESGWERANWFEPNGTRGDQSLRRMGGPAPWSPAIGQSTTRAASRRRSSISLVRQDRGARRGAAGYLESLADNRVARGVGVLTYTQMLNEAEGSSATSHHPPRREALPVITGTAFGMHDLSWIRDHAPSDGSVEVEDVTSAYACVACGTECTDDPRAAHARRRHQRGLSVHDRA